MILLAAASIATVAYTTPPARGQAADVKTAEQVYKNIIALKGTPADQLGASMQFIAASLGVECEFCHVQGKPEADDKPAKKTAREMIGMTLGINKDSFRGQLRVTCFSCHRGSTNPVSMPPVQESDTPARPVAPTAPPAGAAAATPDQIADKYLTAVGGADAIRKISSRIMKGSILAGGTESPIELYTKAPNKRVSVSHMGGRESMTAFDGTVGWTGSTGGAARQMSEAEAGSAALDAEFSLALRLKELFPQLRRGRPEQVNGVDCDVLQGTRPGGIAVRLDFDKQSGLLLRMVRSTTNSMGRMPVQIDYADYGEFDGVKVPLRWTLARPNGRFTIQIKEVQDNVPVDDAKFTKPADPAK
ncbi:MAG: photosynthetic reaction center cytochrome c subunit family protein [Bryobacteraceae bacterium]